MAGNGLDTIGGEHVALKGQVPEGGQHITLRHDSDAVGYREYLVGVWSDVAAQMHQAAVPSLKSREQLNNRFFQDFSTLIEIEDDATIFVADILRGILEGAKAQGGFGLAANSIPSQGGLTSDEYLRELVTRSRLSPLELRNRYRISFERAPGETTTAVRLNIEALVGFLADSFQQDDEEPFAAIPAVSVGRPLLFGAYAGLAPFFLRYEEWLAQREPFWPELLYDIRANLISGEPQVADVLRRRGLTALWGNAPQNVVTGDSPFALLGNGVSDKAKYSALAARVVDASATLRDAFLKFDGRDYVPASMALDKAQADLANTLSGFDASWCVNSYSWSWAIYGSGRNASGDVSLKKRAARKVASSKDLASFEQALAMPRIEDYVSGATSDEDVLNAEIALAHAVLQSFHTGVYYLAVVVPYLRGRIAVELGDRPGAIRTFAKLTGVTVGIGEPDDSAGYLPPNPYAPKTTTPALYDHQSLPYTASVGTSTAVTSTFEPSAFDTVMHGALHLHPFEFRFFALQQGAAMLDWADELFESESPPLVQRARELYKGVIFLHGQDPQTVPHFSKSPTGPVPHEAEPAIASQSTRARRGLMLIAHGLNSLGCSQDFVPFLRYSTLKSAADRYAEAAKNAQSDLISFLTQYEEGKVQTWRLRNVLQRAEATQRIASERQAIAKTDLQRSKDAYTAVQGNINKKQAELADSTSFFQQASDYVDGLIKAIKPMVGEQVGKSFKVEVAGADPTDDSEMGLTYSRVVQGKDLLKIGGAALTDGYKGAVNQAATSIGAGAGIMGGFGAFWYASYVSMSGMVDSYNKKAGEITNLQDNVLKEAKDQIKFRDRQLAIADAELQMAQSDQALAVTLLNFQRDRVLGPETYLRLSALAERLLQRYLELAIRYAWLAERALAFEVAADMDVVKLSYRTGARLNLGAADLMLAALAELENARIEHLQRSAPITHTLSLSRDFPLALGRLRQTGQCDFETLEDDIAQHYPGAFNLRVRAVSAYGVDASAQAVRGVLWNSGHSALHDESGSRRPLVRFGDAQPLSEFRLRQDRKIFGFPGEALLAFEGSGIETQWHLELPRLANPGGLQFLTDVFLTLDCHAQFSPGARQRQAQATSPTVSRAVAILASGADMTGLAGLLAGAAKSTMSFDLSRLPGSPAELNRQVRAVGVLLIGFSGRTVAIGVKAVGSRVTAAPVSTSSAACLSTAALSGGTQAASELDKLVSLPFDQIFEVTVDLGTSPLRPDEAVDVLWYAEYIAHRA